MMEFISTSSENCHKTEAIVTTLGQLVPGFKQAYDANYADYSGVVGSGAV